VSKTTSPDGFEDVMDIRGLGGLSGLEGLGPLGGDDDDDRQRDRDAGRRRHSRREQERRPRRDAESLYLEIKNEGFLLSQTVLDNIEIIVESRNIESRWGFVCGVSDSLGVASIDPVDATGKKAVNQVRSLVKDNSRDYGLSIVGVVDQETVGRNANEIQNIADQASAQKNLLILNHSRSHLELSQERNAGGVQHRWQLAENYVKWSSENFTHQLELTDEYGNAIALRLG